MFEYLQGKVTIINPAYIVLDVVGVGYKLYTPNPYQFIENKEYCIFVEQVVRENAITLYGFATNEDKQLFLKLISVSGIGPKSALAIMAAENSQSLMAAIEQGEIKYLTKFPGVGKKVASQIILDLKGKLDVSDQSQLELILDQDNPALKDAILALSALGYSNKEVEKIKPKLEKLPNQSADLYIKEALKLLLKQ